ncbi:ATP-dependent Clp protease proteolytic subunit [Nocardia sp. NPDC051030]|uniref:ATP-dependent Clp protease proteolytic subunit n=1 Tax=Nocardia sp. NPDC051030 TaxID=3155162 RepID=UPI00343C018F
MSDMFEDRTLLLSGELGTDASNDVIAQLMLLESMDPDQGIRLYLDCPTGSLPAAFAVCDAIECLQPPVSTWAIGGVGSVAALVLCSGTIGHRYALPGSNIVLRQPGLGEGLMDETPMPTPAAYNGWIADMIRLLAERTGKPSDTIATDLRNSHYLSASGSVAYGIVDRVMPGGRHLPQAN